MPDLLRNVALDDRGVEPVSDKVDDPALGADLKGQVDLLRAKNIESAEISRTTLTHTGQELGTRARVDRQARARSRPRHPPRHSLGP